MPGQSAGQFTIQVGALPIAVTVNGRRHRAGSSDAAAAGPQRIAAPMPGKIVRVFVRPGDTVTARQPLVVVEAMKMENELRAEPRRNGRRSPRPRGAIRRSWRPVDRHPVKVLDRFRGNKVVRAASFALTMVIALLAAAIVVSITIDLGPYARRYAERAASNYLERPFHIGALEIRLFTGQFLIDDIRIDGLHPGDRPFFTAQADRGVARLDAGVPSPAGVSGERRGDHRLADAGGALGRRPELSAHRARNARRTARGERTVTVRWLRACARGIPSTRITRRRGTSICRNLDVTIGNLPKYHGTATFTGGTVGIQQYVPMWANMKAWFDIDGTRIRLSRIDLDTDGASTVARGELDFAHWPDQTYQVKSRVNFPRDAAALLHATSDGTCPATAISRARSACRRTAPTWRARSPANWPA